MSSKKKHRKKHSFKHVAPQSAEVSASSVETISAIATAPKPAKAAAAVNQAANDFSFVKRDLTKVAILAVVFISGQFGLWYLFNHTHLGPMVYSLIKL